jgi:hypothetical protein
VDERVGARTIAERLRRVAAGTFVGRTAECDTFRAALAVPEPPFNVLHVMGPGGIGKSALLRRFAAIADEAGVTAGLIDGRQIEPAPDPFIAAARTALGFDPRHPPEITSYVLLVDAFDMLAPLGDWLVAELLPSLPSQALVVLAARHGEVARTLNCLEGLVHTVKLRNLTPEEGEAYLERRGVIPERREEILRLSHCHPLAMAIAADTIQQTGALGDGAQFEIIAALLDRLIEHAPSPDHRLAIEIAAHARVTTEALLADAIGERVAGAIFSWLRGLSFMEASGEGLMPHDLARDIVHRDLAWRSFARLRDVHQRTRQHYLRHYREGTSNERMAALRDLVYLHRLNPIMQAFFEFRAIGHVYAEPASPQDHAAIVRLISQYEGERSAVIARHWLERQPQSFIAMRSAGERLAGTLCQIDLTAIDDHDVEIDPLLHEAIGAMTGHEPRPGEAAIMGRFMVSTASYQGPSPATTAMQIQSYLTWMTASRLSWSFIALDEARDWGDLMRYIDFAPVGREITALPPRRFRIFGHDWRKVGPIAWFEMMERRELETKLRPDDLRSPEIETIVLSEIQFRDAVRQALRHLSDERLLATNPLLRARLLMTGSTPASPAALRQAVVAAAAALKQNPRDEKFHQALDVTFLRYAPSQEAAAERLGLPFGTYRYRLATGVDRVADILWQEELAAQG